MFKNNNKDNHDFNASIAAEIKGGSFKVQINGDKYGLLFLLGNVILDFNEANKESISITLLKLREAVEIVRKQREEDDK